LTDTGITFLAADDPHFNSETIGILAAIAEEEAIENSRRTKDRLAEAKRHGVKLGSARPGHWKGREHRRGNLQGSKEAARVRSERTRDYYAFVTPRIIEMRKQGASYRDIVETFNEEGLTTQRGKPYTDVAVMRIIRRYERDTGETVPSLARSRRSRT
jgi:DNA invertase Pin-like site-specific DNA recombinase